ncbi:MAG: discoidin domain-containing protein, partial [Bacillota bacterium]
NATNEKTEQGGTPLPATQPTTQPASGLVQISIPAGKPLYIGTPKDVKVDGPLEKPRKEGEPRRPFLAPPGTVNLAAKRPVTSSEAEPIIGSLDFVTDGDKEGTEGSYVELGPNSQWVQIDLGKPCEIWGIAVWHYHADPRVYKDVVVQLSDDPNFITGVTTAYNNDHDNSSGFGLGKAPMYFESHEGKLIETNGQTKGRYVRLYSRGSTAGDENRYIEVEVYGIPAK